jgi:hypothetical protein
MNKDIAFKYAYFTFVIVFFGWVSINIILPQWNGFIHFLNVVFAPPQLFIWLFLLFGEAYWIDKPKKTKQNEVDYKAKYQEKCALVNAKDRVIERQLAYNIKIMCALKEVGNRVCPNCAADIEMYLELVK